MEIKHSTQKYIKSPLNYTGGKYKLLPEIMQQMPRDIETFYDIFTGGCNVGINIQSNDRVCNDISYHVIDMYKSLQKSNSETSLDKLDNIITKYNLSDTNREGFLNLREDFNKGDKSWDKFYALITHAFNYQIRFNNKGEYNMPFGKERSSFNPRLRERFTQFHKKINSLGDQLEFTNLDFRQFEPSDDYKSKSGHTYTDKDVIYCDPPYLISTATYNKFWTEKEERDLLDMLDKFNSLGIKFILSNVLIHKGKTNKILQEWSDKYNLICIDKNYNNCSYQLIDREAKTMEVIITN